MPAESGSGAVRSVVVSLDESRVMSINIARDLCLVCDGKMSQDDVNTQQAILVESTNRKGYFYAAHVRHFFTDEGQQTPDYSQNMERMARVMGACEGWDKE